MNSASPEWQYFQEHEASWMKSHNGEWVCIHKGESGGFHKSQEQAIRAALARWSGSPGRIGVFRVGEPIETIPLSELAVASVSIPM